MSPTHTPHFFCCRPFKKHLKRWRRKWNEVTTYEVQVLNTCITICRPSFEVPVWQNWSLLSLFPYILRRKPLLSSQSWQQKHFVQNNYTASDLTCARKNLKRGKHGFNRNFVVGEHFWKYYWCTIFLKYTFILVIPLYHEGRYFFQYRIPYPVFTAQVKQEKHELNYLFKCIPSIWKWIPFLPSKILVLFFCIFVFFFFQKH